MAPATCDELLNAVDPLMRGFPARWCVAGGWAIDVFLGRTTRAHHDVELAIFRKDQALLHAHFSTWSFQKVMAEQFTPWPPGEQLELPIHEIHARSNDDPSLALEFLLNEQIDGAWAFRRNLSVTLPLDRAICRSETGLPILCPAIVLLYKAKSPREKDNADFQAARFALKEEDRRWLRSALQRGHPGHPWLEFLMTFAG